MEGALNDRARSGSSLCKVALPIGVECRFRGLSPSSRGGSPLAIGSRRECLDDCACSVGAPRGVGGVLCGEGVSVESDDDVGFQGAQREESGGEVGAGVGERCGGVVVGVADESAVVEVSFGVPIQGVGLACVVG